MSGSPSKPPFWVLGDDGIDRPQRAPDIAVVLRFEQRGLCLRQTRGRWYESGMAPAPNIGEMLSKLSQSNFGIKFGPGALPVVGGIAGIGLIAAALVGWALHENPWAALAGIIAMLGMTAWAVNRSLTFAEKDPATSLMSGAQLLKLFEHQMGAKDKSIIVDGEPLAGLQDMRDRIE
jgi:hypothetical protein